MLNNENSNRITTKCIDCLPLVYIACPQDNGGVKVIMAPITEEQEEKLNNEDYIIIRDQYDKTFLVDDKKCYAYGTLNLSPKSEDIRKIKDANWFKNLYVNIIAVNDYDFETNTVTSDVEGGRWYETDNVETYLPFLYAKIGKPERVVIFRDETDVFGFGKKKAKAKGTSKSNKKYAKTCIIHLYSKK